MSMCRVELKDLETVLYTYNKIYEKAKADLEVAFEQYKAEYKFSILDKLFGKPKLSGKALWYDKVDSWYHPSKYLLGDEAHNAFKFISHKALQRVIDLVISKSDDIYLDGKELEFYTYYKEKSDA